MAQVQSEQLQGVAGECLPNVRRASAIMAAMVVLLLGGCQSSPQPRAPKLEVKDVLAEGEKNPSQSINDITTARQLVDGLIALLGKENEKRRNGEEVVNDITFFGTLTAVAGVVGKSIAARNVGAGVAGIASVTGAHYQFDKQKAAFQKAVFSAQCLRSALNGLDESTYGLFPNDVLGREGSTDYDKLYAAIPGITYDRYVDITNTLISDLDGISTASGSLADVQGVADAVHDAADKARNIKTGNDAGRVQAANDKLASADVKLAQAHAKLKIARTQTDVQRVQSYASGGNEKAAETQSHVLLAKLLLAVAQADHDKATKAADPSAEPKRTAFLVAVVSFKANAELCTKVTVNK